MWRELFSFVNIAALIGWTVLALAPRRFTPLVPISTVCLLCACYVGLVATAVLGGFGPSAGPAPDFTTLEGVRAIFASDGGVVAGWTHYLAFDLFVGVWIAQDADERGISRIVQFPILLLTFVAGPAGLLLHYGVAAIRQGRARGHPPR